MARWNPDLGHSSSEADQKAPRIPSAPRLAPWQIKLAQDQMFLQLKTGLQLADVAARLRISPTHFSKAFRNSVGLAPSRWYQRERIAKSMRLLREGALELSEIASECGYFDESLYIRTFSRAVGMPPGRWRRKQAVVSGTKSPI